ncbi:histidinol-phosphate transaminase [Tumebacillus algifaecis]|uniref:Histidinol-phosphate aminotransferase n=1 Tax=Tumebacillus algifaecis TaxID=1214604 RepID=A0A223D0B5_9BACL|nr:histidinol-phosphate transaminase [Tumebacillus algifaecis]ASS74853.1 histidinol-phosphate transaminase [Tumebacillus algifaecis]
MSQEILINVRKNLFEITPYAPGKPISDVKREFGLTDVTKLASNENPLGPSKRAQQAILEALQEVNRYPDGGAVLLKEALSDAVGIPTQQILIGNGSDDLIKLTSETFLNPGDEIVVPSPSFSQYWFGAKLMDAKTVAVPLTSNFEYDLDAMLAAVTTKTKILFLCSPNNPTGTYIREEALQRFLDLVPSHVLVILDEAYNEYVTEADYAQGIDFLKRGYNVLVMRTFSKMYGLAGLRLGYVFGPMEVLDAINRAREPFNANMLAQVGAVAALTDLEHVEASRIQNRAGFDQLQSGLSKLGYTVVPSQGNFLIFDTGLDDRALFDALLREGVIVRGGTALGIPGYLRVSIGLAEENERFLGAFEKVVSSIGQKV